MAIAGGVGVGALGLAACGSANQRPEKVVVQILDVARGHPQGSFNPAKVVVTPGSTVTWVSHTSAIDSVTADNRRYGSALLRRGQTYTVRFGRPGTYRYHDIVHFIEGEVQVR